MLPKVIQLRLIKARRQLRIRRNLEVLQRRAERRDNLVCFHCGSDDAAECGEGLLDVGHGAGVEKEVEVGGIGGGGGVEFGEDGTQDLVGDVVGLDDAACAPDLPYIGEVDLPVVLLVCAGDDVETLDVACQECGVCCFSQVFDELVPVSRVELLRREAPVCDGVCALAVAAVGGGETQGVGGVEGGGGDVGFDGFCVAPDAGSFFAGYVLDDLVEDGGYDWFVSAR